MDTGYATILVDYDFYRDNATVGVWLWTKQYDARFVLLVSDPENHDYKPEEWEGELAVQFDVVVTNSSGLPDHKFKANALDVIKSASNLNPVMALEPTSAIRGMYATEGLLISLGPDYFKGTVERRRNTEVR